MKAPARSGTRRHSGGIWHLDIGYPSTREGRFSVVCIVEHFSRALLALEIQPTFNGHDVVRVLERLASAHGVPSAVMIDTSALFQDPEIVAWAARRGTPVVRRSGQVPFGKGLTELAIRSVRASHLLPGHDKKR